MFVLYTTFRQITIAQREDRLFPMSSLPALKLSVELHPLPHHLQRLPWQVFCFGVGLVGTQSDAVTVEAAPVCLLDAVANFLTVERLRLRAEREANVAAAAAQDLEAAQTGSLSPASDAPSARSRPAAVITIQAQNPAAQPFFSRQIFRRHVDVGS